jgi:flagellar protein FlbD
LIELSRLNGKKFILNCELIKMIEATPDTVITLTSGEKLMVKDQVDAVVERSTDYLKRLRQEPPVMRLSRSAGEGKGG